MRELLFLAGLVLVCGGCTSVSPRPYEREEPALDLSRYLDGPLDAWGMFQDRQGTVVKRFHVKLLGTWRGNVGTLEEDFTYSDGVTQRRVWTITRLDDHHYTGTAADVVGVAAGEAYGNALNWRYVLALAVDGKVYKVHFDDWMFLVDDEVMLNRAVMSKWGIRLGEVTLSFRKAAATAPKP